MHSSTMFAGRQTARRATICLTLLIAALQVPISRCQGPTSPDPQDCREHQQQVERFRSTNPAYYFELFQAAIDKDKTKSLQIDDVLNFYKPQCDGTTGEYLSKQCSPFPYCWCSTPDGEPINGTAQYDMSADYCSVINEQSCVVNGHAYTEGDIFSPPGVCGQCECLAGSINCFVNFTVDEVTGYLSNDQLESFKTQLVQVFSELCNNSDGIDIRQVLKAPIASSDSLTERKNEILQWKFEDYDRNYDNVLKPIEEFIFHEDVFKYFGCNKFNDQLNKLLDTNDNNEISLQEWQAFFGVNSPVSNTSGEPSSGEQQPVKREARHFTRKPLHLRKKFHFVYSDGQAH